MSAPADLRDIAAWQLAHLLNLRVDLFLLSPDFKRHYGRVEQLGDAVRSGPRNIAEGFAHDRQAFADRVRLAKGSEAEVLNHLIAAYDQRLITLDELQIAERLTRQGDEGRERIDQAAGSCRRLNRDTTSETKNPVAEAIKPHKLGFSQPVRSVPNRIARNAIMPAAIDASASRLVASRTNSPPTTGTNSVAPMIE